MRASNHLAELRRSRACWKGTLALSAAIPILVSCGGASTEERFIESLDEAGLLSDFSTDKAAVRMAEGVCESIELGEDAVGSEAEKVAVEHYCPKYLDDFDVLAVANVQGAFVLTDSDFSRQAAGSSCEGSGGYSDINSGTEVRVLGDGDLVEVTRLGPGTVAGRTCLFSFEFTVTEGNEFYTVEVGRRGEFNYSFRELTAPGAIAYSLGD